MLRKLSTVKMPKKGSVNKNSNKHPIDKTQPKNGSIYCDKNGNIILKIVGKPGAKCNGITDIADEGIRIQINAPPVDGEANTELIKYLSSILGVRKSDLSLNQGSRSRQKTVSLQAGVSTVDEIREKLEAFMKE